MSYRLLSDIVADVIRDVALLPLCTETHGRAELSSSLPSCLNVGALANWHLLPPHSIGFSTTV